MCGDLHWPITRKRGRGEGVSMPVRYGPEAIQDFGGTRGPHRALWDHVDEARIVKLVTTGIVVTFVHCGF